MTAPDPTLAARIAALADGAVQLAPDGRRLCPGATPAEAFCREITETHLPRILRFANAADRDLTLIARAGRVLALGDHPDSLLTPDADATLAEARQTVAGFLRQAGAIRVIHDYLDSDPGVATGVAPGLLIAPDPARGDAAPLDMADFLHVIRPSALALLHAQGGTVTETAGDPALGTVLQELAARELADTPDLSGPESCVIFGGLDDADPVLLCGQAAGDLVFVAAAPSDLPELLDLWTRARSV